MVYAVVLLLIASINGLISTAPKAQFKPKLQIQEKYSELRIKKLF